VATAGAIATIDPQLREITQELVQATVQVHRLVETCDDKTWARRPSAKGWSPAECVIHLNKTSETALPLLRKAVGQARAQNRFSDAPYRLDFIGRQVLRFTEPPYRIKAPSPSSYFPDGVEPPAAVLAKFEELQRELIQLVESADGLALCEIQIPWPVYVRIKYNMFASLKIIPAHQRRHLWQAEQAVKNSNRII
jgi:DinB superfamily